MGGYLGGVARCRRGDVVTPVERAEAIVATAEARTDPDDRRAELVRLIAGEIVATRRATIEDDAEFAYEWGSGALADRLLARAADPAITASMERRG